MLLADVFLATQIPYVMVALFCFLVVPIEVGCFIAFQRSVAGFWASLGLIVLANAISVVAGYILMIFVPVPAGFTMHESQPQYLRGVIIGFVVAFFLSWLIEYSVVRLFRRRFAFVQLGRTMGIANAASYVVVFLAMLWHS